jgi:hypothetical protein
MVGPNIAGLYLREDGQSIPPAGAMGNRELLELAHRLFTETLPLTPGAIAPRIAPLVILFGLLSGQVAKPRERKALFYAGGAGCGELGKIAREIASQHSFKTLFRKWITPSP